MVEEFEDIKSLINTQYTNDIIINDVDEEFVKVVAERVAELMESNMELFFNHLYRMDIDERKVHIVLNSDRGESAYVSIARIIIERQRKRLETKRKYKQNKIEGWDDF